GLDRLPSGAGDALMAYLKARGFNPRQDYGLPPHVQQFEGQYGATRLRVETRYVDMGPKGGDIEASVIWSGRGWYGYVFGGPAGRLSRDLRAWWQSYKAANPPG